MPKLRFDLNKNLYVRDPQATAFGQKLLASAVNLMAEIGFEQFTFKKLAEGMDSVEASIYRYFANKHMLLLYLTNWYSEWASYSIKVHSMTISQPKSKLEICIENIVHPQLQTDNMQIMDIEQLRKIVIEQSSKTYHVHEVDEENQQGLFSSYKKLNDLLTDCIHDYNSNFHYPRSLASTVIEMVNQQLYFAEHLPRMTELKPNAAVEQELQVMINAFVFKLLD